MIYIMHVLIEIVYFLLNKTGFDSIMIDRKCNMISDRNRKCTDLPPTQFCNLPGFYRKTGFLRSHPLSLLQMKKNN